MPLIDKPLAELAQYQGTNPRPVDFDAYWEAALAEMRAIDAQTTLVPAAFSAPNAACFDLYFTGTGGSRIHAKYLRPAHITTPVPCVLMFHGYTGSAGDWADKLAFVNMGMAVMAMDVRGQGGTSEDIGCVKGTTLNGHIIRGLDDAPERLLFRNIFLDAAQLAGIAMAQAEIDETRVGAMGGSQGGALTIACAALEPRVVKAAPEYPFLSDYQRVWEMDLAKDAYAELRAFFRRHDPEHARETEIFTRLGYIDIQNLASRVRAEVLWGIGLMDTICPPSTQFATYNKLVSPKRMRIYPDFGHEGLPGFQDQAYMFMAEML